LEKENTIKKKPTALEQLLASKEKFHIFNGMNDADITAIVVKVEFNTFAKGEIVIKEGDKSEMVYFILSGTCNVVASRSVVGTLESHALFGEISGLEQSPRQATVRATSDVVALAFLINYKNFERAIVPFAYFYKNLTKNLIGKLTRLNIRKKQHKKIP
jgi:signal-transduction protein with cAMP-binding, CBS, and nucleotidyltransferase domain